MKTKNFDIAIYGAGPAAIFLVNKLSKLKLKIALIEKGDQYKIVNRSPIDKVYGPFTFNKNNNLEFGSSFFGTAAYWQKKGVGGKFGKFDENDILDKWPINFSKLNEKYEDIIKEISNIHSIKNDFLELDDYGYFEVLKKNFKVIHTSGSLSYNFKKIIDNYKRKILSSKNISYLENCELIDFEYSFEKKKILNSKCRYKNNEIIKVESKAHILSLGCLENNRLLLNVFKNQKKYLNQYNFGKKIMFHPNITLGKYKYDNFIFINRLTKKNDNKKKILTFKEKNFKNKKDLNSAINFSINEYRSKNKYYNLFYKFFKFTNEINVFLNFEHLPYDKSSLSLSTKIDENGLNKINIFSSISDENIQLVKEKYSFYVSELKKINLGNGLFFNNNFEINFETNNHHHGGLIFSNSNSPVNPDFTLKNFDNLYINGSSIFPTSSVYGPTFTIIACSYILYDNLCKRLNFK